jgi:hypothetical protein
VILSQAKSLSAHSDGRFYPVVERVDLAVAAMAIIVFALIEYTYQYRHILGEPDLYRVLVGLLDGAASGRWLNSPLHYDREFGFGYLAAIFHFVDPAVLTDPDRLIPIMNRVGLWALAPGLVCFWIAVRLAHGAMAATVALMVFSFSPMIVELGTSGHPSLPMFAFLSAAALCLFLPLRGWPAILAGTVGMLLLVAGFLSRGEIFLAFPWLVLTRIDTGSLRRFVISGLLRSVPPIGAIMVFLLLQHQFVTVQMGSTIGQYIFEYFTWATVPPGIVYMATGCGLATALLAGLAVLWLVISGLQRSNRAVLTALLGPLALVAVPMAFFLPNPMPTRHFMLTLAGFGIILGILASRRPALGRTTVYAGLAALVIANHVLAELVRPLLLRVNEAHSPYLPSQDIYQTTTHANIGWFWQRHAALIARRERWQALGDRISTSCDSHTLALTDEGPHLFTRLYASGVPVKANVFTLAGFFGIHGVRDGKDFIVMEKMNGWPDDAVATVLADPALNAYHLVEDPWTMSKYDRTPIPPNRAASFGCAPDSTTPPGAKPQ